jgi:hypothetical protein
VCQHCLADARMVLRLVPPTAMRRDKRIMSLLGEVPIKRAFITARRVATVIFRWIRRWVWVPRI